MRARKWQEKNLDFSEDSDTYYSKNTWRSEIAATQTKSAYADSIQPAEAGFVCVAPDFQSVGDLQDWDALV